MSWSSRSQPVVDLRLAVDRVGELYVLSKGDGVIRAVTGALLVYATLGNRGRWSLVQLSADR